MHDPSFLFKVAVESGIDAAMATYQEVTRMKDYFLQEAEFYFSDLVVGTVLDCTIVSLLAPAATLGRVPQAVFQAAAMPGMQGKVMRVLAKLPAAFFAAAAACAARMLSSAASRVAAIAS